MPRFTVYPNPDGMGYLLDVQADLLADLNTRMVVPLLPVTAAPQQAERLNPLFVIEGTPCLLLPQFMAAVPRALLRTPLANLSDRHADITGALDLLFQGY